jgi:hypothetical protein
VDLQAFSISPAVERRPAISCLKKEYPKTACSAEADVCRFHFFYFFFLDFVEQAGVV